MRHNVNAICPGYVLTPLVQKQIPETAKARGISEEAVIKDVLLHAQPTKKFVTTEQIGALSVFLCIEGAASITGTALPIEGGWTARPLCNSTLVSVQFTTASPFKTSTLTLRNCASAETDSLSGNVGSNRWPASISTTLGSDVLMLR